MWVNISITDFNTLVRVFVYIIRNREFGALLC